METSEWANLQKDFSDSLEGRSFRLGLYSERTVACMSRKMGEFSSWIIEVCITELIASLLTHTKELTMTIPILGKKAQFPFNHPVNSILQCLLKASSSQKWTKPLLGGQGGCDWVCHDPGGEPTQVYHHFCNELSRELQTLQTQINGNFLGCRMGLTFP